MEDWSKLSARERFDRMVRAKIERTGTLPYTLRCSNKLIADLWVDGHAIRVDTFGVDGHLEVDGVRLVPYNRND